MVFVTTVFDIALKKILQEHEEKSKVLKGKYDVRNFQDDIVIFGEDKETANLVEADFTNILKEHGFEVRPEKISPWRTHGMVWYHYRIEWKNFS